MSRTLRNSEVQTDNEIKQNAVHWITHEQTHTHFSPAQTLDTYINARCFWRILLWLNVFLCINYTCTPHKLATILLDEIVLNGLSSARINFDTVGGTRWGSAVVRFGPGPSVFMFTALTLQWRVDKLITQQSSQANTTGLEMAQQSKLWERQSERLKIMHKF